MKLVDDDDNDDIKYNTRYTPSIMIYSEVLRQTSICILFYNVLKHKHAFVSK